MGKCLKVMSAGVVLLFAASAMAEEPLAFEDVVYLTCEEVAERAGDDEEQILAMIRVLAEFSLDRRGLVVPEDRGNLGLQFVDLIRAFCTAEPDGLLYNAVDRAMRRLL